MVERNLLIMFALIFMIFIITSMAFASTHQMNYNNMQGRNSNSISMQRANNYMHMSQQNNFMHNSIGNSRMNSQQNAYIYMPDHRNINAHMYRY